MTSNKLKDAISMKDMATAISVTATLPLSNQHY